MIKSKYPIFRVHHHREGGGCYDTFRAEILGEDRDTRQKAEADLKEMKLKIVFDVAKLTEKAIEKKLKELGWVKLKPGQVVAEKMCMGSKSIYFLTTTRKPR